MLEYYRGNRLIVKRFKSDEDAREYVMEHFITEYYLDGYYYLEVNDL